MKHVVMFSGGMDSWMAAKRVVAQYGPINVTLLCADTSQEDEDWYRFLVETAANVGAPLVLLRDGRTPWQVFRDKRFIGNSGVDPCSKVLKRDIADAWLKAHCDPAETVVYLGISWDEPHRFTGDSRRRGMRARYADLGYRAEAPLLEPPYLTESDLFAALKAAGIRPARLYEMGFAHNNCGGFCVKAGQGHFAHLLKVMPKRYREHEAQEQSLRDYLGADVSILRDRRDDTTTPLTLRALRERIEAGGQIDLFDIGGCGCFMDEPEAYLDQAKAAKASA